MAPKKTTGKGKPPITQKEKAESCGLSLTEYQNERVPIASEMKAMVNKLYKEYTTGKALKPGDTSKYFTKAWSEARKHARDKYGDEKLKKLGIKYKDPTPAELAARKSAKEAAKRRKAAAKVDKPKKKKSATGKKGTAKSK
jgi:hypothetical protein